MAETTVLAERGGVARADYLGFINGSVVGSTFSRYETPQFVHLDWTPTFTSRLGRKDFEYSRAVSRPSSAKVTARTTSRPAGADGRQRGDDPPG